MTEQHHNDGGFERLGEQIAGAEQIAAQFAAELARFRGELSRSKVEVSGLSRALDQGLRQVLGGVQRSQGSLGDQLRATARRLAENEYRSAIRPVREAFAAKKGPEGIVASQGAQSGLTEQISPRHGGQAAGRPMQVVFNISTPDVAGFRRSQSQIAAQMSRLLAQGERNG